MIGAHEMEKGLMLRPDRKHKDWNHEVVLAPSVYVLTVLHNTAAHWKFALISYTLNRISMYLVSTSTDQKVQVAIQATITPLET